MHASSKPSTHRHRHAEIPQYPDGESEGGLVSRSHARSHSRDVCRKRRREHREHEPREREEGLAKRTLSRQIAIAHESRSFILYSAQGTRERLDQSAPKGETRMEQRKRKRRRKTVRRYLSRRATREKYVDRREL